MAGPDRGSQFGIKCSETALVEDRGLEQIWLIPATTLPGYRPSWRAYLDTLLADGPAKGNIRFGLCYPMW